MKKKTDEGGRFFILFLIPSETDERGRFFLFPQKQMRHVFFQTILQGSHGQGKVREKWEKFKVREKSGNFEFSQGNLKFWQKSGNFRIRSRRWRNQVIREINEKITK